MASATTRCLLCVLVLSSVAVFSSQAACTNIELGEIFTCITPYGQQFEDAIGLTSFDNYVCNTSRITTDICRLFRKIVTCVNGLDVSRENCLLSGTRQVNVRLGIPCSVEDFYAVCKDAPPIGGLDTTSVADTTV